MGSKKEIKKFANEMMFSDVRPYEVVEIKTSNKVMIRMMNGEMINGPTLLGVGGFTAVFDNYSQKYEYHSNENYPVFAIRWSEKKQGWYSKHGQRFLMSDEPSKFYDYNF